MKTEELKALGLTDEQATAILVVNGKDVEKSKLEAENYKTQFEAATQQLKDANTAIESYKGMDIEGIKQSADKWKAKYEADTLELNKALVQKDYDRAMDKFFSGVKFVSEYAKSGVINEFKTKEFKLDGETFLGAEDYMKAVREKDPTAFVNEEANSLPIFSKATSQNPVKTKTEEKAYMDDKYKGNPYYKG